MSNYQKYLDPEILNKISRFSLKTRLLVDGYIAGTHQSSYRGTSPEFIAHREYVAGDDLRHLDWKVFGRSDRLYIKQYKQETNLTCHILVDISESMAYGSSALTKTEYARYLAASLSYLLIHQQDAVGLVLFNSEVRKIVEPHSHQSQLYKILSQLSQAVPGGQTDFKTMADYITEKLEKRGLVILISDLFDDPSRILSGLNKMRSRGQDVIVFHVLDNFEVKFPFSKLTRFAGLENYPEITANPQALQRDYLRALNDFIGAIRKGCENNRIDYVPLVTDQKLDVALSAYLASRLAG